MRKLTYELVGQFILSRSEDPIPDGWQVRRGGPWFLASHPTLPVIDAVASDASHLGWLLGYPIHPSCTLVTSQFSMPVLPGGTAAAAHFEDHLYTLGGRFAAVYLGPTQHRVYLDPCGSLAAVFCPEQRIVASSPNLIPPSAGTPEDRDLIQAVGVMARGRWYPFGLTPRKGVERLLPNHALDLETWQPVRHWPSDDLVPLAAHKIADAVAEIAAIVENAVAAVARVQPAATALTAGRHSRMQLACARDHLAGTVFFTIPLPDDLAALDCAVAQRIARRFHLDYVTLAWEEATTHELDAWLYRTGGCVAGRASRTVRTLQQLDPGRCVLSAVFGELGDPGFWRNADVDPRHAAPLDLLKHYQLIAAPELVERARQCLDFVPARDSLSILDFLRLEQFYGSSLGPEFYGYTAPAVRLSPFCHRRIVELTCALPWDYRRRDQLSRDLIRSRWPELLRFPFNEPPGPKAIMGATKRAVRSLVRSVLVKRPFRRGRPRH